MNQTIHLYTICWNEANFLEFFFRYYDPFVSAYHFYDDGSDDGTLDILQAHPRVQIHQFETSENSYVLSAQKLHNQFWKNSREQSDWVIITAVDELLYHPKLPVYLEACTDAKITAIPAIGFQMIDENFPTPGTDLTSSFTTGALFKNMNKLSVFNPREIQDTNYSVGRHRAAPTGNVKYPEKDVLLNLHYKYLSIKKTYERHQALNKKLRSLDKARNYGHRYRWDKAEFLRDWYSFKAQAIDNIFDNAQKERYLQNPDLEKWWRA